MITAPEPSSKPGYLPNTALELELNGVINVALSLRDAIYRAIPELKQNV
jgi:hypothetical protein